MARRSWMVSTGDSAPVARRFEAGGAVTVGDDQRPGPNDLRGLARDEVMDALRPTRTPDEAYAEAGLLLQFRDHVRVGDVVVIVDTPSHQVIVGEITGDYEPVDGDADRSGAGAGGGRHRRSVEWYGRYNRADRSALSAAMESQTHLPSMLQELTPTSAWLTFSDVVRERPPVPAAPPRHTMPRAAATRSTAAAAPRPPRASRATAPAKPKPTAPVYRRCPECQMQKAPAQFRAGSEHCVDCRDRLGED